jgi:hypothetical protein
VQADSNGLSSGSFVLWVGKGDGTFTAIANFAAQDGQLVGYAPLVTDFNGDGKADILWDSHTGTDTRSTGTRVVWLSDGVFADLMTSVTTGIGANVAITHKSMTDNAVYAKDSTMPGGIVDVADLQASMALVARLDAANGLGGVVSTAYAYAGAKAGLDGRGFLGFREMTVTDLQTSILHTTMYRQEFPFGGLVARETKKLGAVVLNETIHTYDATPPGPAQHQVFLTHSVGTSADLDGSPLPAVISSYQYDTYGNPTQIVVSTSDGNTKTTTNTYANDTTKWFLGRLTRAAVASNMSQPGVTGPDIVPDVFGFTALTEQPPGSLVASNSIAVSGINTAVPVIVTGDGAPQIRINGGAWTTSGTITSGQSLEVRLTSANAKSKTHSANVTVGGVSGTWSVTTTSCAGGLVAGGCLFSMPGDYTYTVPAGVTSIRVTVVGGGGGFGSRNHSHWNGYGGAGGGSAMKTLAVTAGQSFNLTVGPGGNSASSDWGDWCWCHGSDGAASTFSNILTATGGQGGYRDPTAYNVQATGGTGSGGDQDCNGGNGTNANYYDATGLPGQCSGGAGGPSGAGGGASSIAGAGRSGVCGAGDGAGDSRNKGADGCVLITPNPPP